MFAGPATLARAALGPYGDSSTSLGRSQGDQGPRQHLRCYGCGTPGGSVACRRCEDMYCLPCISQQTGLCYMCSGAYPGGESPRDVTNGTMATSVSFAWTKPEGPGLAATLVGPARRYASPCLRY